jgi:hypothetical protein
MPHALLTQDAYRFMLLADVALVPTSNILEKECLDALRGWYESLGKTLWTVGPPNPPEEQATSDAAPLKPEDEKVLAFLDRVHKTHGDNSIIYVRVVALDVGLPPHRSIGFIRVAFLAERPVSSLGGDR